MKRQKTRTAPKNVLKHITLRRHTVACVFQTQCTFGGNEVRKSPHGANETVVPRKKALAGLEKEYADYLKQDYQVDRLQIDAKTIALLGVAELDGSWDSIAPDSGYRDTLIPRAKSHYTFSMCFDFLMERDFAEEDYELDDKGVRNFESPSKKAIQELAEELKEHLGQSYSVERLEVVPGGGIYFAMLDSGLI